MEIDEEKSKSNELISIEPDVIEPNLKFEPGEETTKDTDISSMGDGNISENLNYLSDNDECEELDDFEKDIWQTLKTQLKFLEWKNKTTHCHMNFLDVGFKNIREELNDIAERNEAIEEVFKQRSQLFDVYKQFLEEELCKTESLQSTSHKKIENSIHSLERRVESWQCLLEKNVKELF